MSCDCLPHEFSDIGALNKERNRRRRKRKSLARLIKLRARKDATAQAPSYRRIKRVTS